MFFKKNALVLQEDEKKDKNENWRKEKEMIGTVPVPCINLFLFVLK